MMIQTHPSTYSVCKLTTVVFFGHLASVKAAVNDGKMVYETFRHWTEHGASVLSKVGSGGFGAIIDGVVLNHENNVFKHVDPKLEDGNVLSKHRVTSVMEEILIAGALDHHHIVKTSFPDPKKKDLLSHGCLMMMPKAENGDLRTYISKGFINKEYNTIRYNNIDDGTIREWMFQTLRGLVYLHSTGITHCDLKPANILVYDNKKSRDRKHLRLCDFGLAKNLSKGGPSNCGTNGYFAPEAVSDGNSKLLKYTNKVDMWAVGCIMAEILARNIRVKDKQESSWEPIFQCENSNKADFQTDAQWKEYKREERVAQREFAKHCLAEKSKKERITSLKFLIYRSGGIDDAETATKEIREFFDEKKTGDDGILDLIADLLEYDPSKRLSAIQALNHKFFQPKWESIKRSAKPISEKIKLNICKPNKKEEFDCIQKFIEDEIEKQNKNKSWDRDELLLRAIQANLSGESQSKQLRTRTR